MQMFQFQFSEYITTVFVTCVLYILEKIFNKYLPAILDALQLDNHFLNDLYGIIGGLAIGFILYAFGIMFCEKIKNKK